MAGSSVKPVIVLVSFMFVLLLANMLESKSFEVELKDAEPDIIEQLVEFAYTARWVKKNHSFGGNKIGVWHRKTSLWQIGLLLTS